MAEMISVNEAQSNLRQAARVMPSETVPLSKAANRTLASDVRANLTHPPFDASAMDGYAISLCDAQDGNTLTVIGEAPAGMPFTGEVKSGQAVRVFTGSVMPDGAGHVVIQEDVTRDADHITITDIQTPPAHIRKAGIDFSAGETLFSAGTRLGPVHLSVLASANIENILVYQKPRVAIFANGDELRHVGTDIAPGQIISSTPFALAELIQQWGGTPDYLGIAPDNAETLQQIIKRAAHADIIVPVGGASVGDYDLVKQAFRTEGFNFAFEKVAVKPGKPTWFATRGDTRVLGLPGNPASGLVGTHLFLRPLISAMLGENCEMKIVSATLTVPLHANGPREIYHRAHAVISKKTGHVTVTPFSRQDSSLLTPFAKTNALIQCAPKAPTKAVGDCVSCVIIGPLI